MLYTVFSFPFHLWPLRAGFHSLTQLLALSLTLTFGCRWCKSVVFYIASYCTIWKFWCSNCTRCSLAPCSGRFRASKFWFDLTRADFTWLRLWTRINAKKSRIVSTAHKIRHGCAVHNYLPDRQQDSRALINFTEAELKRYMATPLRILPVCPSSRILQNVHPNVSPDLPQTRACKMNDNSKVPSRPEQHSSQLLSAWLGDRGHESIESIQSMSLPSRRLRIDRITRRDEVQSDEVAMREDETGKCAMKSYIVTSDPLWHNIGWYTDIPLQLQLQYIKGESRRVW